MKVDIETKEARFRIKQGEKCDIDEVKRAIAGAGSYTVSKVKVPTG